MIDFAHLRRYRENNRIEAKRATGGLPESIWETYSAFANTMGGVILLGVVEKKDKSFEVVDLPDPDGLASEFWKLVNDTRKASVNILTRRDIAVRRSEGRRIVAITVPRADRRDRPVYVNGDPYMGTYRRDGEGDYHCSRETVQAMMMDALEESRDARLLSYLGMESLEERTVKSYRSLMQYLRPGHPWESLPDEEFLCRIEAARETGDGMYHPTAAGLLMFGKEEHILLEFPEYSLTCQEAKVSGGNLFTFYYRVWRKLTELPGMRKERADEEMTMERALRDALANCLINCDYRERGGIKICISPGQIIMANPGSFCMDVDRAKAGGSSDPRNAGLNRMFRLIQVSEGLGAGLARIYSVWQRLGLPEPVIEEQFLPDRIILYLPLETSCLPAVKPVDGNISLRNIFGEKRLQMQTIIEEATRNISVTKQQLSLLPELESCDLSGLLEEMCREGILTRNRQDGEIMYSLRA